MPKRFMGWDVYLSRQFCSAKCMGAWNVGQNNWNWKSRVPTFCLTCKKELVYSIDVPPTTRKRKFCSLRCRANFHSHVFEGRRYKSIGSDRNGNAIREHVLKAERAIGRP